MMAKTNNEYVAPLVEVIEVEVEKGFATSNNNNNNNTGGGEENTVTDEYTE